MGQALEKAINQNHTKTKPERVMVKKPNILKNIKQGEQISQMHEKWKQECYPSKVTKQPADSNSISTLKRMASANGKPVTSGEVRAFKLLKEKSNAIKS